MRRLEIIHLRLAGNAPVRLIEDIQRSISNGRNHGVVRLYYSATVATDLGIHIHLEAGTGGTSTSDLGVRLAAALREYGMVEHTVWIEDQSETIGCN